MKSTLKKLLSVMLAVVLLFGAAPLCKTDGILATKASALETVSGSYDYLLNYIKNNGTKIDNNKTAIYEEYKSGSTTFMNCVQYEKGEDYLFCEFRMNASSGTIMFMFNITKDSDKCDIVVINESKYGEDAATVTINPKDYRSGAKLSYKFQSQVSKDKEYVSKVKELFDTAAQRGINEIDDLIFEHVGFGLGNFGFTQISNPVDFNAAQPGFFETIFNYIINFFKAIGAFFAGLFA